MRKACLLVSPAMWERGHGPDHPLKPERLRRTFELLEEYGALSAPDVEVLPLPLASDEDLALFHSDDYIQTVKRLSAGGAGDSGEAPTSLVGALAVPGQGGPAAWAHGFGNGDNPVFSGMFETEALKVGGSLLAAQRLHGGACDVAFNFSGGMHHAAPAAASGFCVFNDAAVAIHWLLRQGLRAAYVDIDVHHGDGVQWAFYDTDRALTISLHQDGRTLFPGTGFINETGRGAGEGFSVNLPLPPQTDDESYLWAFEQVVPPLLERFQPDVVVTQLGVDTHFQDPLANLALTTHGHEALFRAFDRLAPKWLALGGGGYALDVVPRSWALAFGVMSGQTLPEELPPSYRARYGGQWLHDHERPEIDPLIRRHVRSVVEERVARVKSLFQIP
ncbi:MAG TPA: acetoin utilization protein AcuC [Anaerolineales bacterium]|nr:acetoin utilization protein AcuC [Anaerolineales bacterium]